MTFCGSAPPVYEVYLEKSAERDLKKLDSVIFNRIIEQFRTLAADPRPPGSKKLVGSAKDRRLRVGDYRVLYEIDDSEEVVRVMRVRHRREAYR